MSEFDWDRYRQLLAEAAPVVIDTEQDYDRMMDRAQQLLERGPDNLSDEESKLLELLVFLIEAVHQGEAAATDHDEAVEVEAPLPHETLLRLLEARGLDQSDIEHVFGNPKTAREFLAGSRPATRGQAKQLGAFFQVPPKLFLP